MSISYQVILMDMTVNEVVTENEMEVIQFSSILG